MSMVRKKVDRHEFDTGWAWAVDIGVFLVIFVLIAWIRLAGLIFVEIQSLTQASTADVAWVSAGNAMAWHFLSPFSAILASRFGTRKVVAVGGLIVSISTSSGFFIRELRGFIVMGVFIGIGGALCFTPSVVFLSYYFRRRLGVATGITSSGSSLSQIIMSPVCGLLLDSYGLPGTLLIFGGISLHLLVSAALFFPVSATELSIADAEYQERLRLPSVEDPVFLDNGEHKEAMLEKSGEVKVDDNDRDAKEQNETLSANCIHASMRSIHELKQRNVWKRVLRNPSFWILMTGYSVGSMTAMALVKYGPPYCMEFDGIELKDVSLFLALSGIPGILMRLLIGITSDLSFIKKKVERYRLFVLGILLTSASCFVFLFTNEYKGFVSNFMLMGVSSGLFYTLNSISTFDLLGKDDYLVGFGLMNGSTGLLYLMDSTVIAYLRDFTGRFDSSFIVCGCLGVFVSFIMLICVPVAQKYNNKRQQLAS